MPVCDPSFFQETNTPTVHLYTVLSSLLLLKEAILYKFMGGESVLILNSYPEVRYLQNSYAHLWSVCIAFAFQYWKLNINIDPWEEVASLVQHPSLFPTSGPIGAYEIAASYDTVLEDTLGQNTRSSTSSGTEAK